MPHRSIIRIPQNKNISKAGNGCLVLIIYFIILLIFRKYWIIINLTVCGLLLTSVVVFYCLKASHDLDSDESSTNSDDGSSSDSDEEPIYQAEIVSESPPSYLETISEITPSAPPQKVIDTI